MGTRRKEEQKELLESPLSVLVEMGQKIRAQNILRSFDFFLDQIVIFKKCLNNQIYIILAKTNMNTILYTRYLDFIIVLTTLYYQIIKVISKDSFFFNEDPFISLGLQNFMAKSINFVMEKHCIICTLRYVNKVIQQ